MTTVRSGESEKRRTPPHQRVPWLSKAKASISSRLRSHFLAIISAERNWFTS